jgi:hypothetical protein
MSLAALRAKRRVRRGLGEQWEKRVDAANLLLVAW